MSRLFFIIVLVIGVFNISCSSNTSKNTGESQGNDTTKAAVKPVVHHLKQFETGQIINHVICRQDSSETFCLYLPKDYDTSKSWPVIYFFDAHARGKLPLKKYEELAEKYRMIFIGSNNSQNGLKPEMYDRIVNNLFATSLDILNIDKNKITVSGFSGGAKVAGAAAIANSGISSVIGCAAPMDFTRLGSSYFNYVGIVGKGDFNYWDMVALDNALAKTPLKHQLLTFDGIHEWPNQETFSKAILFTIKASKNEKTEASDKIDPSTQENEEAKRNSFITSFKNEKPEYWISLINALNDGFKNGKTEEVKWMDRRLLSFINMLSYLKTSELLNGKHLDEALPYLKVFIASDPKNPDGPMLYADYYAISGQNIKAIESINDALKLGYDDFAHFSTDPMLASLKTEPGYAKVYKVLSN